MTEPRPTNAGKVAIVGLDGATYRVLDAIKGAMPCLERLRDHGLQATLRSTVPTYTPPAWVSMVTGVNPGRHGIFGFLANTPQEEPQIAHSGLIGSPPLWRYLDHLGVRSGAFNVPMSYPPVDVNGFMVAGGLAAGWTDPEMPNFASSPEIGRLVSDLAGGHYPLDVVVTYENDWQSAAVTERIERTQALRRRVLNELLEREDVSYLFAVFEGPDRLQHVHYQYFVPYSEWYDRPEASEMRAKALSFFAEVDRAIADLVEWAGTDGHVLVVSDHGFGPWEKTLNVNVLLQEWGYLKLPAVGKLTRSRFVAGAGQRVARRVLPRRLLHKAKARVGRGIAWEDTLVFGAHVAEQGIHVNVRGDVPKGVVSPEEGARLALEVEERLLHYVDPADGLPVVDHVVRRDDALHGPFAGRAPHLYPFCRDQRYELNDTLAASGPLSDHRDRPWGYHHIDGILVGSGPGLRPGALPEALDIVDVLPTSFHLAGLPVPAGLDGRVVLEALEGDAARRTVETFDPDLTQERREENPFSPEEEASIEESLRGLGYID